MGDGHNRSQEISCAVRPPTNCAERILLTVITYLVPYLPVTPTFLVLFVILAEVAVMNDLLDGWSSEWLE